MPDRLGVKIDPYVLRLSHSYGTLAFIALRPSNAGVAEATIEYEKLAPLMQSRSCLRTCPEHLSGLDDDRSRRQRAHRGVACGKAAMPLQEELPSVPEDWSLGDGPRQWRPEATRYKADSTLRAGGDDGDRRASAI